MFKEYANKTKGNKMKYKKAIYPYYISIPYFMVDENDNVILKSEHWKEEKVYNYKDKVFYNKILREYNNNIREL